MRLAFFLLYVLYCFYIGLLLVVLPWSALWDANLLLRGRPVLASMILAGSTRGLISGLGVLLIGMGVHDAVRFVRRGWEPDGPPGGP